MEKVNDGGPAFPSSMTDDSLHIAGMTLRDYFAAKALAALIQANRNPMTLGTSHVENNGSFAVAAYALADAMIHARGCGYVK